MRLLLVIPRIVSYQGFLRELCASLAAGGADIHLASSPGSVWGEDTTRGDDLVTVHEVDLPRGIDPAGHLRAAGLLNRLIDRLRPDIIHAHFSAAIFTTAVARTPRWPATLATFHGVSFLAMSGWKARVLRVAESWAARRFDGVWVLNDEDRAGLKAVARETAVHRLDGFGVGCNLEKFTPPGGPERVALRAALGIGNDEVVFAFTGRFVDFKGFGLAVRAFQRLAAEHANARLLLIGARDAMHPTGLDPAEEAALRDSPRIIDAGYQPDVRRCLGAADVFVFPSEREGMPVCLMESLALGVPVITYAARGCRDIVRDGIDGLVLPERTVGSFHAAMERALKDEPLRRSWSWHALADRERFSRARFIAAQTRIYETSARMQSQTLA